MDLKAMVSPAGCSDAPLLPCRALEGGRDAGGCASPPRVPRGRQRQRSRCLGGLSSRALPRFQHPQKQRRSRPDRGWKSRFPRAGPWRPPSRRHLEQPVSDVLSVLGHDELGCSRTAAWGELG